MEYYTAMKVNKILIQIMWKSFRDIRYQVKINTGNSLVVHWLGIHAFTAKVMGSVARRGTKILQAAQCGQKKKKIQSLSCMIQLT